MVAFFQDANGLICCEDIYNTARKVETMTRPRVDEQIPFSTGMGLAMHLHVLVTVPLLPLLSSAFC